MLIVVDGLRPGPSDDLDGLGALGADGLKSAAEELVGNLTRLSPGATAVTRLLAAGQAG